MIFPFSKTRRLTALDIGSHTIKALEVTARGQQLTISGYAEIRTPEPETRAQAIEQMIEQNDFSDLVISSISGRSVIVRYITLRDMADEELANAVRLEADKYIPFEADQVVLDYYPVEKLPESKEIKVLLVAARRSTIDDHVSLLQSAGLQSMIIDIDTLALANAFEYHKMTGPAPIPQDKVYALVDIGSAKTSVHIMHGPVSRFSKEIYIAGSEFCKAIATGMDMDPAAVDALLTNPGDRIDEIIEMIAIALDDLANEVRLCFDYYESQFERAVDEAYISGGCSQLPGLERFLERIFDVKTLRWDPTEKFHFSIETVNIDEVKRNSLKLAVVSGLATRAAG